MKNNFLPKGINLKTGGRLFGFGTSPQLDWKIIFISAAVFTIIGIFLNVFIFIKIDKGEIFVADAPTGEGRNTLDIKELNSTLEYYQNKERAFQNYLDATSTAQTDPSI